MYIFSSFTNMHSRLFALCNIYKTHILNRTMNIVLHIQAPAFMKQSGHDMCTTHRSHLNKHNKLPPKYSTDLPQTSIKWLIA